jgi:cytochrome c-type biogenesis protein CcmH/NrfF
MRFRNALILFAVCLWAGASLGAANSKPTLKSLGDAVICQCGCNQTMQECNHIECASRAEMTAMAQKEIAEGKDETTILQDFVLRYGVQVLATPPAKGFNMTVWILPGLGLMASLGLVIYIIRRWRRPPAAPPSPATTVDPKLLAAMEEEMKKVAG